MSSYTTVHAPVPFAEGTPARECMINLSLFDSLACETLQDGEWSAALGEEPEKWGDAEAEAALTRWGLSRGIQQDVIDARLAEVHSENFAPWELDDSDDDALLFSYVEGNHPGGSWIAFDAAAETVLRLHAPDKRVAYAWVDGDEGRAGWVVITAKGKVTDDNDDCLGG